MLTEAGTPTFGETSRTVRQDALVELGAFVRAHRERAERDDGATRVRTPGRTRGDVATKAGVSVDWYTRIEQGRAPGVSNAAIDAIGAALGFDALALRYAECLLDASCRSDAEDQPSAVPDTLRAFVDALRDTPAYVMDASWDVLAHNPAAAVLFPGIDRAHGMERNCLWQHFRNEAFCKGLRERDHVHAYLAALFRFATAERAGTSARRDLVDHLLDRSDSFRHHWNEHAIADWGAAEKVVEHPERGTLTFTNISHRIEPMNGQVYRVVSYVPVTGTETSDRIRACVDS